MPGLKKHKETLRSKSLAELREVLVETQEELFNLRFQRATRNLDNHRNIRTAKREIARIHTLIREAELAEAKAQKGNK